MRGRWWISQSPLLRMLFLFKGVECYGSFTHLQCRWCGLIFYSGCLMPTRTLWLNRQFFKYGKQLYMNSAKRGTDGCMMVWLYRLLVSWDTYLIIWGINALHYCPLATRLVPACCSSGLIPHNRRFSSALLIFKSISLVFDPSIFFLYFVKWCLLALCISYLLY